MCLPGNHNRRQHRLRGLPSDFAKKIECIIEFVLPEEIKKATTELGKCVDERALKGWADGAGPGSRGRVEAVCKAVGKIRGTKGLTFNDLKQPKEKFAERFAKAANVDLNDILEYFKTNSEKQPEEPSESYSYRVEIFESIILSIEEYGWHNRVCIDLVSRFEPGEFIPTGSQKEKCVLLLPELFTTRIDLNSLNTKIGNARPFRVNVGYEDNYILTPEGWKRAIELHYGDYIISCFRNNVNNEISFRKREVARIKVEDRLLNKYNIWDNKSKEQSITVILQPDPYVVLYGSEFNRISIEDLKIETRLSALEYIS